MTEKLDNVLPKLSSDCEAILSRIIGTSCCFQEVGEYRSLHIGFGERIEVAGACGPRYRSEWDIGTYNAAWRILQHGRLLCGNLDPVDSNFELNEKVEKIQFGSFVGIEVISELDLRMVTDNGVTVEFLCASSDDDEFFHIFGTDGSTLSCTYPRGWLQRTNVGKTMHP